MTVFDSNLHEEIDAMKALMIEHKGVGISANQCGIDKSIFLMKDKTTELVHEFINPTIIEKSDEFSSEKEGCLSSPGIFVRVPGRHQGITLSYQDRNGEQKAAMLEDIEATCAQHEIDHLNGIFFLSRLPRIQRRIIKKVYGYEV